MASRPLRADEAKAPVLAAAVGRDPELRRRVTAALTPDFRMREVAPDALGDRSQLLDAAAAVVVLDAGDDLVTLRRLEALRSLPLGRSLVLLLRDADEGLAEAALARLAPRQVLVAPCPDRVLRYAAECALPAAPPGQGARREQRPAPALLGVSSAIRGVLEQVRQIGPAHIPVLILGETGTGKELVARAIHEQSARSEAAFVAVNCGALPDSLLESELFGYRKGAFTGAERDHLGLFEMAHGGTLFLDEIGDTSPALQVKLLRALETGEIRAVGDTAERRVDVRLVSATHSDLEGGSFRRDLFYRINTVTIHVPPLRRRRVDIPFLAQHFAEEFGAAHARRITLDEAFLEALTRCDFPGNVRELRNAVERAIALAAPEGCVSERHLEAPGAAPPPPPRSGTLRERIEQVEAEAIREALAECEGNRTWAAERLGLSRPGLRNKMRRLGLDPETGR